ncbi:MAG: acetyl-CoA carboxylase biotin carboxyl carrier protein subunit [Ruminococcus sp.]|nr:acetyl-CoA carboxylase biotin carboxyl carrier protein subunit [Ruminococcus sp.]
MKRYNITVNGTPYDVVVEEADANGVSAPAPVAAPAPAKPAAKAEPAPAQVTGGTNVESPMPGVILDVKVNVGNKVTEGQALFVLEAMKMENDVNAPCAGTVASVNVSKQANVETGTVLAVIK